MAFEREKHDHKSCSSCILLPSENIMQLELKKKKIHKVILQCLDYINKSQVSVASTSCFLKPETKLLYF